MRVLMIVSNDVVNDSRPLKEARTLREAGHDVTFIGWDRSGTRGSSIVYDGFPIRLVRTRRLLRVVGSDLFRNPIWWRLAYRLAREMEFDVVHCHDLDTLPVGAKIKQKRGVQLVYDSHEIFGYMIEDDMPRLVVEYAFRMERGLIAKADRVLTVTESVKAYLDSIGGKSAMVVRNCEEVVSPKYIPPPEGPFTILYIGTLHANRFLLPAIDAVGKQLPDVRLVIGGSKRLTTQVQARCGRYPNTRFVGLVQRDQVLPRTLGSHAVLAMLDPTHRNYRVAVANKVYEAMAAGRPSLNTKGLPGGDLAERESCGLAVPYTDEGLLDGVIRLRDEPRLAERLGRNGLDAAKREYNWAVEGRKLVRVYDSLPP